jgi:hypothetical protein
MSRPYTIFNSRTPLVFDGNQAVCFILTLVNDVPGGRTKNIASGVLYTWIIRQDEHGGYSYKWPVTCLNAVDVDQTPGSVTVQNFIGITGGRLLAIPPGTVTQKETP